MQKRLGHVGITRFQVLVSLSILTALAGIGFILFSIKNYISTNAKNASDESVLQQPKPKPKEETYDEAAKLRDTQRQLEIDELHKILASYKAVYGRYPSLQDMNSDSFRAQHFKNIDMAGFGDPLDKDTVPKIVGGPQEAVYAYDVRANDQSACDNIDDPCTNYILTALLENGERFVRLGK